MAAVEALRTEVASQRDLLDQLTRRHVDVTAEQEIARLRWALVQTNAANGLLHEAADAQEEARQADGRAGEIRARAYELVRRSDRARSELLGTTLMPDDLDDNGTP